MLLSRQPRGCKASALCISLWRLSPNRLVSFCAAVDQQGCGKVDNGSYASLAHVGRLPLSTSKGTFPQCSCMFCYRGDAEMVTFPACRSWQNGWSAGVRLLWSKPGPGPDEVPGPCSRPGRALLRRARPVLRSEDRRSRPGDQAIRPCRTSPARQTRWRPAATQCGNSSGSAAPRSNAVPGIFPSR
jgi:hypothetical protein